jgi:hypothetical protein
MSTIGKILCLSVLVAKMNFALQDANLYINHTFVSLTYFSKL